MIRSPRSRALRSASLLLGVAACGDVATAPDAAIPDAATGCDLAKPFASPMVVAGLDSAATEISVWLSADERTAYLTSDRAGNRDLYLATRSTRADAFSGVTPIAALNTAANESGTAVTADGLTLVFARQVGDPPRYDLFVATRAVTSSPFGTPRALTAVNDAVNDDVDPALSPDGKQLYFASTRSGNGDLYLATGSGAGDFGAPAPIPELNGADTTEGNPFVSADGLEVVFNRFVAGADVWTAARSAVTSAFASPAPVAGAFGYSKWLSSDGCRLYISGSLLGGNPDILMLRRP